MINIYYRSVKEERLNTLDSFKTGSWVNVYDPTEDELEELVKMLGIEKDLLHDALDPYEVPRLEQESGVIYVFARVPKKRQQEITTVPILVVLGDDFVLTVSREKLDFLDEFTKKRVDFFTTQKIKFFLKIFLSVNRQYELFLININKAIRGLRIRLERMSNRDLIHFVDFERVLNDFLSALTPAGSVLQKMLNGRNVTLYEDDRDLVEDIFLSNGQMVEMAKSTLRYVVNIRDTYSNIITQDLNRVMKILTSLTILLTIPTMIFSFYGMNVDIPHTAYPQAYILILVLTVFISTLIFALFKRNRWL
ncbi:MAG: magnesium transporter CorA family protein [Parcubacteria group bacterium]|jgi:magnesium transporter